MSMAKRLSVGQHPMRSALPVFHRIPEYDVFPDLVNGVTGETKCIIKETNMQDANIDFKVAICDQWVGASYHQTSSLCQSM